jgi:hypothetical protein
VSAVGIRAIIGGAKCYFVDDLGQINLVGSVCHKLPAQCPKDADDKSCF